MFLKSVKSILTVQTAVIMLLSVGTTWICRQWGIYAEFPLTLIATAVVFPIVYRVYFAYISKEYSPGLEYVTPILFSVILVCLDNILDHLENPFDLIGDDDVIIKAEKFIGSLEL